ncbi:hypothetical protein BpHYR1_012100 [Brachionus plicatilis]|uniref:Uncharacterized protein n=1 Tax=Brachionus plicatilis TaxID=10195 RepID=A0A3M7R335_BRAPC|nr:hypothetical protein BpHYR1_012100 [Brachionus plicatilis]
MNCRFKLITDDYTHFLMISADMMSLYLKFESQLFYLKYHNINRRRYFKIIKSDKNTLKLKLSAFSYILVKIKANLPQVKKD